MNPARHKPKEQIGVVGDLESKVQTAKNKAVIHLCSKFLQSFPNELFSLSHLRVINLGQNNIEVLPDKISVFKNLTQLHMNNNPLQYLPISISECRYLQVLDLSNTYVKILPFEISLLKQLYDLNLDGCPLKPPLDSVYKKGVLPLLKYYEDKLARENYREKLVKAAKEEIWIDRSIPEIQDAVGKVLDSVENDSIELLKKLQRNLKYILPQRIEETDPFIIRLTLTGQRGRGGGVGAHESQFNNSVSASMHPGQHFLQGNTSEINIVNDTSIAKDGLNQQLQYNDSKGTIQSVPALQHEPSQSGIEPPAKSKNETELGSKVTPKPTSDSKTAQVTAKTPATKK